LIDITQPVASSPSWVGRLRDWRSLLPDQLGCTVWELCILCLLCGYFLLYGLVPYFGGDQLGLVGADEPRYAQIAREMLQAHSTDCHEVHAKITPHSLRAKDLHASYDCLVGGTVTPILYGRPWLEKPALYYWRAMSFFKELGIYDWTARLPSASAAAALLFLAFLHLRRFRPGGHLDAALIMLTMAGMVGFARGASTDMQLAAPLSMGLLGWYAWYETGKKFWLFDLYFFGAAAVLAKGPVAIFLMLGTIMLFLGMRREWTAIRRTIWLPGLGLFLLMVLPWFIAVQRFNPTFFRVFFFEHNIERFATDRYQHSQHWFYYVVVLIVALLPWTALAFRALFDGIAVSLAEWKVRHKPQRYLGHVRAGDAFPEFLVLWSLLPVVFFSFSVSKLPGYILPSLPPLAILTGDYLFRIRRVGISTWLLYLHAALTGFMTFVLLLSPQYMIHQRILPAPRTFIWAAAIGTLAALLIIAVVRLFGVKHLRSVTLVPLVGLLFFLLGMNGHLLDLNYSSRPLAREIAKVAPPPDTIVAVPDLSGANNIPHASPFSAFGVRRDLVYGIAFYRDEAVVSYAQDGIPDTEHILVIPTSDAPDLPKILSGRNYQQLFSYKTQGLSVYKVYPRG
jgi:4-amino-4-deoxy-L-arabinose transferase-like glycosyltransferase